MNKSGPAEELLLIGLGGLGISTAIAIRASLGESTPSGQEMASKRLRLFAVDVFQAPQNYLSMFERENFERPYLDPPEYLGLGGQFDPWIKVVDDAQLGLLEAKKILAKKRIKIGLEYPNRADWQALIYVSRDLFKNSLKHFLENSSLVKEATDTPIKIVIVTSLFGDAGSLSYLELLTLLTEISSEIEFESIDTFLYSPKEFSNVWHMHMQDWHDAKYLSMINAIENLCFLNGPLRLPLNQRLISLKPKIFKSYSPFEPGKVVGEVANGIHSFIEQNFQLSERDEGEKLSSNFDIETLNHEKIREIKELLLNRDASNILSNYHWAKLVQEFSS